MPNNNVISSHYKAKRDSIIEQLLRNIGYMDFYMTDISDVYSCITNILSNCYIRNEIDDFEAEVAYKVPMYKSQGYEINIDIQYPTKQYDCFSLIITEKDMKNHNNISDPIAAYDRAMGIL